jgi:hypothetical protein
MIKKQENDISFIQRYFYASKIIFSLKKVRFVVFDATSQVGSNLLKIKFLGLKLV